MKTIYILLTRSGTILSNFEHLTTTDTYTHASIAFDENLETLYSSSRKNGRTTFPAGPCTERLDSGYYQGHDQIPCAVYELQVSDEAYENAKLEVARIMEKAGEYHFNIIGLLLCQMNIPCRRKRHFFCSQFVSEVLSRSHALELPKDTSLMRPSDYTRLPGLLCQFRGRLSEFLQTRQFRQFPEAA